MHISKDRQLFLILISAIFLIFFGGVAGGFISYSLVSDGYVEPPVLTTQLKYRPPTTFSADFQKVLEASLVKIIKYQNLDKSLSVLEKADAASEVIANGFLVSSDGWIVAGASPKSSFLVLTQDGNIYVPQKIVKARDLGLSFIKIVGMNFKALSLGDERSLDFGDDVFAIKNQKVFKNSLIYFGYNEPKEKNDFILSSELPEKFLFLKDKLSNEFSGLPLFSKQGEIVGVADGNGLIFPVSLVKIYLKSLWKNEAIVLPYLGLKYFDLSAMPVKLQDISLREGAYIFKESEASAIIKNSPAAKAGLLPGDIILSVRGDKISAQYNLAERILEYAPGDKIDLEVSRNGEKLDLNVELGEQK